MASGAAKNNALDEEGLFVQQRRWIDWHGDTKVHQLQIRQSWSPNRWNLTYSCHKVSGSPFSKTYGSKHTGHARLQH